MQKRKKIYIYREKRKNCRGNKMIKKKKREEEKEKREKRKREKTVSQCRKYLGRCSNPKQFVLWSDINSNRIEALTTIVKI